MSIFVRRPQYIKNAYSCAESFSHWERFLKTTASLSNSIPPCFYNPANFIGVLTPMAGVGLFRVGLKVLIPTRCHARNQASRRILFRSIYICYERSSSWILSLVAPRTPPLSVFFLSRCVFLHRVRYRIRYRACGCRLPLILPMSLNDNSHQRTKRTRSSR